MCNYVNTTNRKSKAVKITKSEHKAATNETIPSEIEEQLSSAVVIYGLTVRVERGPEVKGHHHAAGLRVLLLVQSAGGLGPQ